MDYSQEELKKLLSYDNVTGTLHWRQRPRDMFTCENHYKAFNSYRAGKEAGSLRPNGYMYVRACQKRMASHRIIWTMFHGSIGPNLEVDHINGNPSDNRLDNLRVVSRQDNAKNLKKPRDNTSGVVGVRWESKRNRWLAYIRDKGVMKNLGRYSCFGVAVKVRRHAESNLGYHSNHGRR